MLKIIFAEKKDRKWRSEIKTEKSNPLVIENCLDGTDSIVTDPTTYVVYFSMGTMHV